MNKNIKLKVGDILTYQISNENVVETTVNGWAGKSIKEFENVHPSYKVLKLERPQTIYKFKEVLDEKEKEYLSAVIRPFKKRVIRIEKIKTLYGNSEFINIVLYSSISCNKEESIQLPYFKKGKIYKGMKRDKKYTLKELGLDQ